MSENEYQDELQHYGILRKSGRYPWGSGGPDTAYHRSMTFYDMVNDLKAKGIPEKEIADAMGLTVAQYRDTKTIAKEEIVMEQTNRAVKLRAKGVSIEEIAKDLGMEAPTVRLRLKQSESKKTSALRNTAAVIRENVDKHGIVDVGKGVEHQLGIADTKLRAALAVLHDEGYESYPIKVKNVGTRHFTTHKVMVPPGTGFGEANRLKDKIHTMGDWTEDDGATYSKTHYPRSVSSKRVKIMYKEDGGADQDGTIFVRPGVKDLDMGKNTYAQVRILVDDSHYMKGMAVLNNDMPNGYDLVYHTPKPRSTPALGSKDNTVMKPKTDDPDSPFGSIIKRQIVEKGPDGKERPKSALNIVNEEGDWDDWRKSIPSQVLAKQPHSLIRSQLQVTRDSVKSRLDEINTITNAVVRKKKLEEFAEQIDSDAVDLRAAQMPRQRTQVIIPMPKMRKEEIYAPNFETGEKVVLIRYPHGGRFEIPEVTVNNNNRTAKKLLGNATDAIGIHPDVASRLSGADFDGDSVVVIPNRSGKIKGVKSMGQSAKIFDDALNGFEPKTLYGGYQVISEAKGKKGEPGYVPEKGTFKAMTQTGLEMGKITNLITDMSIQGAKPEHVVRAVKHSMVVIDAEKHKLNYKQSEIDNGIKQLKDLYQSNPKDPSDKGRGARTLLSQATAGVRIPDRELRPAKQGGGIDPVTGAKIYADTGKMVSKYDKKTQTYSTTEKRLVETEVKRLALTDDANDLVRDKSDPVERLYAEHANEMKALANAARLSAYRTPNPKINSDARSVYKDEVAKLNADLKAAEKQKPLDRRAKVIAGSIVKQKRQEDPLLRTDPDRLAKVEHYANNTARARLGLEKPVIDVSDRQWDAIMAGAVSSSRLGKILAFTDPKRIDDLSMPKGNSVMSSAITARAKAMLSAGATTADVAAALGIPLSTLKSAALRGDV